MSAVVPSDFFDDGDDAPAEIAAQGQLWRWQAKRGDTPTAWFFVTITGEAADAIRRAAGLRRGFGSVKVGVRVGGTRFETSLFPDKASNGWMLPVKASVRKAEKVTEGDTVELVLEVVAGR